MASGMPAERTERTGVTVMIFTSTREVSDSNLGCDTKYPDRGFHSPSRQMPGQHLDSQPFSSSPLQPIILSTLCILPTEGTTGNKAASPDLVQQFSGVYMTLFYLQFT
jgi:hypothetical protein